MHHTKFKADIGVAKTIADLISKGHIPSVPLSEHQPYDLVVVLKDGRAIRMQVKYATLKKNGTIEVKFRTMWVDKNSMHTRYYKNNDFEYYAIYCPDKEKVLYIPNTVDCPRAIRFEKTSNNQLKNVKWANDYLDIKNGSPQRLYAADLKGSRHSPDRNILGRSNSVR